MAVKFTCDGCGMVIGNQREFLITAISLEEYKTEWAKSVGAPNLISFGIMRHLCERCERQLREMNDPTNWLREQRDSPA